jgi:DNA-binding GntR family transcriptional regulator
LIPVARIERPESLKDLAYRRIRDRLVAGELRADSVYSAIEFAQGLGVSRTPVREALLQLASEGFLEVIDGRGFRVRDYSEKEIRDIFETRRLIEIYMVERAAEGLSAEELAHLDRNQKTLAERARKSDPVSFLETDREFHMSLVRRNGNDLLVSLMDRIRNHMAIFGLRALSREGRIDQVVAEHGRVLKAHRRHEPAEAVRAMRDHLLATEKHVLAGEL